MFAVIVMSERVVESLETLVGIKYFEAVCPPQYAKSCQLAKTNSDTIEQHFPFSANCLVGY